MALVAIAGAAAVIALGNRKESSAGFVLDYASTIPQTAPLSIEIRHPEPVIARGAPGEWDAVDVLNPSVIRLRGRLHNYYSGFDGKVWRTGLATSTDGITWKKSEQNPLLSPGGDDWDQAYISANGAAIEWNGKVLYFYQGVDAQGITKIGLAISDDGISFSKVSHPVFDVSARPWESKAVADPYVVKHGGMLYMYYLGMDAFSVQRLGVAQSADGVNWIRSSHGPVLDVGAAKSFDERGLGEPSVAYSPPYFYMLYTGRDASEKRDIGLAISGDGVHWKKMSIDGLFSDKLRVAWNSHVICDTTLLRNADGTFSVWYGGGNRPSPDQNLNGQIGTFILRTNSPPDGYDAAELIGQGIQQYSSLKGSFEPEGVGQDAFAWIGKKASIALSRPTPGQRLVISGWAPASLHQQAGHRGALILTILVNGKALSSTSFLNDGRFEIEIEYQKLAEVVADSDFMTVELAVNHTTVPAKAFGSADVRDLSLKISKIKLTGP